jgi:hypothetical protein
MIFIFNIIPKIRMMTLNKNSMGFEPELYENDCDYEANDCDYEANDCDKEAKFTIEDEVEALENEGKLNFIRSRDVSDIVKESQYEEFLQWEREQIREEEFQEEKENELAEFRVEHGLFSPCMDGCDVIDIRYCVCYGDCKCQVCTKCGTDNVALYKYDQEEYDEMVSFKNMQRKQVILNREIEIEKEKVRARMTSCKILADRANAARKVNSEKRQSRVKKNKTVKEGLQSKERLRELSRPGNPYHPPPHLLLE